MSLIEIIISLPIFSSGKTCNQSEMIAGVPFSLVQVWTFGKLLDRIWVKMYSQF